MHEVWQNKIPETLNLEYLHCWNMELFWKIHGSNVSQVCERIFIAAMWKEKMAHGQISLGKI